MLKISMEPLMGADREDLPDYAARPCAAPKRCLISCSIRKSGPNQGATCSSSQPWMLARIMIETTMLTVETMDIHSYSSELPGERCVIANE